MNIANKKITALCILACGGLFGIQLCPYYRYYRHGRCLSCTVNGGDESLDVNLGNNIEADEMSSPGNATNWKIFR